MLALAVISTVLLGLLIMLLFITALIKDDDITSYFIIITMLGFVIMSIWFLYTK